MSWKVAVVGGVVFYLVTFVLGFVTGPLIHNGVLKEPYRATASFWRPELRSDPPDMMALMPLWIPTGLLSSMVTAAIYSIFRRGLAGPGWKRGLTFGLFMGIFACATYATWFGVFDLPAVILAWWGVESLIMFLAGGAVMGLVAEKLAPG